MKDAGILDGDHVVVRRQDTAGDGEIVVALVGEEATVKRFFKESDHVRLQPENEPSSRSAAATSRCSGRVVGVLQEGRVSAALLDPLVAGSLPGAARRRSAARAARHARAAARRALARPSPAGTAECPGAVGTWARGRAARCGGCGSVLS